MEASDIVLGKIQKYGMLKLHPERICKLLGFSGCDADSFLLEFQEENSQIRIAYDKGLIACEMKIDAELIKKSVTGDITAITELNTRQYRSKINAMKKELFGI